LRGSLDYDGVQRGNVLRGQLWAIRVTIGAGNLPSRWFPFYQKNDREHHAIIILFQKVRVVSPRFNCFCFIPFKPPAAQGGISQLMAHGVYKL
jgi:hypothetical protein